MKHVETEGETIDEAIENALNILGVARDKVSVDILEEGKKGLLGFGRQYARIRASLRETVVPESETSTHEEPPPAKKTTAPPPAQEMLEKVRAIGKEVLEHILKLMGVTATVEVKEDPLSKDILLDMKCENSGLLIGRRGQTLEALQYLLSRVIAEKLGPDAPQPVVDTENYRIRRVRTLEDMALRLGEKAKRSRKTLGIDALSARDRRIIHVTLQDDPWLTTKSLGKGPYRRLLIIPEGDRKKADEETVPSES